MDAKLKIRYDFPKEVIDTLKNIGTCVSDFDEHKNIINYYNLPQWFKDVNGHFFECPFDELPEQAKEISNLHAKQVAIEFLDWIQDPKGDVNWFKNKNSLWCNYGIPKEEQVEITSEELYQLFLTQSKDKYLEPDDIPDSVGGGSEK